MQEFGGNQFQRFWRKIVSNILEEICFTDFERKLFQRFWRKLVSKILEDNCFKDFGGFFLVLKINHATSPKLYRSYYPHRSRDSLSPVCGIFKASALWAYAFYKSICPSVCLSVCPCVRVFTFEVPFNGLFAPTFRSRMSNIFRDSESLGKSNGEKWSQI